MRNRRERSGIHSRVASGGFGGRAASAPQLRRRIRRGLAAAVVAAVWARPDAAPAARSEVYALVGGRIVTVSGPTHDRGTLVMRDGVIEAVGPSAAVPPDARVIRADNLVLTPGLIDGFSGTGLPVVTGRPSGTAGSGAAAAPPPSLLAPQAMALDRVRVADALKARDAGITTVLVVPREGVLPGQSVILNLSGDKAEAMALKQPAALHLHMSTLAREYPGSLMGTVAYARQCLDDAIRYRDEWAAYERSPAGKRSSPAARGSWSPRSARTTCGGPWRSPTSSRSRSRWRARRRPSASPTS